MTFRLAHILSTFINLIFLLSITFCAAAPTSTHILEKRKGGGGGRGGRGGGRAGLITGVAMAGLVVVGLFCYGFIFCTRCAPCCGRKRAEAEAEAEEETTKVLEAASDNEPGADKGEDQWREK